VLGTNLPRKQVHPEMGDGSTPLSSTKHNACAKIHYMLKCTHK